MDRLKHDAVADEPVFHTRQRARRCGYRRVQRVAPRGRIKLLLIRRTLVFTLVLSIIGTLQLFNEPEAISTIILLPMSCSPNMFIYNEAFNMAVAGE